MSDPIIRKALIIGAGDLPRADLIKSMIAKSDLIICADGGYDYARKFGIKPHVLIGDLDSISLKSEEYIRSNRTDIKLVKHPVEKDESDLELSIEYAISENINDIIIFGAVGSRLDHSLSNILLLVKYSNEGNNIKIIDDKNTIVFIRPRMELLKSDYKYSLIPISMTGIVVSLKGFKYELDNHLIPFGTTLGISNFVIKEKAEIELHSGIGLLIKSID